MSLNLAENVIYLTEGPAADQEPQPVSQGPPPSLMGAFEGWVMARGNPKTRRTYRMQIGACARAAEYPSIEAYLGALSLHTAQLGAYTKEALERQYAPSTARVATQSLKGLCAYLFSLGLVGDSLEGLAIPKPARSHINNGGRITLRHLALLEKGFKTLSRIERVWSRALLGLLFPHALRVGEILSLRKSDLGWGPDGEPIIWFVEKGHTQRSPYPLLPETYGRLIELIRHLERKGCDGIDAPLFPCLASVRSARGLWSEWTIASADTIRYTVKKWGDKVGLKGLTPHDFRHSAATLLFQMGVSTGEAAALLRHSEAYVTAKYYQDTKGDAILATAKRLQDALANNNSEKEE